jgi:Xaa-Pro aminopeptidase
VPDVLIFADTIRSPELRHEVPVGVADEFLYVERDGTRHVVVTSFELPMLAGTGDYLLHPFDEFGVDELRRTSASHAAMLDEIVVRACRAFGVERALVPPSFPVGTADRLRAEGIELTPDRELFESRRRVKTGAELAGIRRAQAAAEAGMAAARDLLRDAAPGSDGVLDLDGRPLTSERLRAAIQAVFIEHGATADAMVVAHGPQAAIGHHLGSGAIRAGEPVIVDLWPKDDESSCSADMTRTFVVGEVPDEIAGWHRACREALDVALTALRPGVTGKAVNDAVCEVFEREGFPTQRTKADGVPLEDGFYHALGHGVGLEVHEPPTLNLVGHAPLVAGDVVAVEPGLYRPGFGGVRLEDLVRVTEDGIENLTHFAYELAP